MQKHVNLVDLVKSFPTNIFLQNLASIEKRTSPIKFDHFAEKSDKGSLSNLSTKVPGAPPAVTDLPGAKGAMEATGSTVGGGADVVSGAGETVASGPKAVVDGTAKAVSF